jgi:PIN domain nuclease of toxin-antitoxin system
MRFLIDTHCFLWLLTAPELLRRSSRELIANDENIVVFSVVSGLEIAIKTARGKFVLPEAPAELVPKMVEELGLKLLPVYLSHALRVAELPLHHGDPFGRLLIAQCQIEGIPIMTADASIATYDVELLWAGRGAAPRRPRP